MVPRGHGPSLAERIGSIKSYSEVDLRNSLFQAALEVNWRQKRRENRNTMYRWRLNSIA